MSTHNDRNRQLAERALELANNDIALAVRILAELTGLGLDEAFDAVDAAMPTEVRDHAERPRD